MQGRSWRTVGARRAPEALVVRRRWLARFLAPLAVAALLAGARPALADAVTCKDGTQSQTGRGACSHHGGVAAGSPAATSPAAPPATAPAAKQPSAPKTTPPAAAPAPVPAPAPPPSSRSTAPPAGRPTAQCRDGSWSYAQHHSGACSRHGGVARWTDGTTR